MSDFPWKLLSSRDFPGLGEEVFVLVESKKTPEVKVAVLERTATGSPQFQWRFKDSKKVQVHNSSKVRAWRYIRAKRRISR